MSEGVASVAAAVAVGLGVAAAVAGVVVLVKRSSSSSVPLAAVVPQPSPAPLPIFIEEPAAFEPVLVTAVRTPGNPVVVGPARDVFIPGSPEADNGDLSVTTSSTEGFFGTPAGEGFFDDFF